MIRLKQIGTLMALAFLTMTVGCAHLNNCNSCNTCETSVCDTGCNNGCDTGCNTGCEVPCDSGCRKSCFSRGCCGGGLLNRLCGGWRSNAIPETLPLGSTVRAHYQAMETNGEAADFILFRNDFVASTAALTPDGKDKIAEIAARMRSTPFPVLIERSENNSNPELDAHRRNLVASVLSKLGNPDSDQRTIVATPYGNGYNSIQAEFNYYRFLFTNGGQNGNNGGGNNGGGFGGGGGGFGGGGF